MHITLIPISNHLHPATILEDDRVKFRGETTSLSKSALTIVQELGYNWDKIAGPQFWTYKGKTLYDLANDRQ